jgi:hypothetical protein
LKNARHFHFSIYWEFGGFFKHFRGMMKDEWVGQQTWVEDTPKAKK